MHIEIMDGETVVNTILADEAFAEQHYPGAWRVVEQQDAPVVPATPQSCTRRQGQLALIETDRIDAIDTAIAGITDPIERRKAQAEYDSDTWERNNAFLQSMWAQLGGTPAQLDDLFRLAVTL